MPQIAAGTVVPYKTRVDGTAADMGDSDGSDAYLASILSELERLIELLRVSGNQGSNPPKIIIDGREVFSVVVNENNRAIQRTGASPIRV